jgi:chorismate lyase / 3-hydroxybenzoate synthase
MRIDSPCRPTTSRSATRGHAPPPLWVQDLFASVESIEQKRRRFSLRIRRSPRLTLVSGRIRGATLMNAPQLRSATAELYATVADELHNTAAPVRFWNHIPAIHAPMGDLCSRYMIFNAGRYDAFERWYGGASAFPVQIATATGVGSRGRDLVVHCLATDTPGTSIENPRQVPAYRYSSRYGPLPPCFARATLLPAGASPLPLLLVGGTASVRGEESMHRVDLPRQIDETLVNLASLVRAGCGTLDLPQPIDDAAALAQFRELRVYHPQRSHRGAITRAVQAAFPRLRRLEMMQAELCRAELLVEIEGIAEM